MLFLTINHIKFLILLFYLFTVIIVICLSWLYLIRTTRATKAIGLQAPEYIKIMARISIANALLTAFLITFFLSTHIY
ncbi:MAG TPA: hypothetical protein VNW29_03625 [Candidatus Sulfotelmatobacter sp.]|nr:hypothetical protein [Candidatus Sulfotelmatobacter sp.]